MVRLFEDRSYRLAKVLYRRRTQRDLRSPIVVLSMGKTATTAVADAIQRSGVGRAFQVHSLRPGALAEFERRYRASDRRARPYHIWDSQLLLGHPPAPSAQWQVVTVMRDPLRRVVSAYFQTGRRFGDIHPGTTVEEMVAGFGSGWEDIRLDWFEWQFGHALGVDVFAHPFDPAAGYGVIDTPEVKVLLLRQEHLDVAPSALAEFFGTSQAFDVRSLNAATDKDYSELYAAFLRVMRPPDDVMDRVYSSRMVGHFYSDEEIAALRESWG